MKRPTLTLLLYALALSARAELKPPAIRGDSMVLQGVALSGFHSDWVSFG